MKRKRPNPSRQLAHSMNRRLDATAEKLRQLAKQVRAMRSQIDELGRLNSALDTAIGNIDELKRSVGIVAENVSQVRADVNSLLPHERHSGTRASTLGAISKEGRIPINRSAARDAGILSKKT